MTEVMRMEAQRDARSMWPRMIVSGHAKLPQEAAARAIYEILSIVVSVDPRDGTVLAVDCTLVTQPAKEFVEDLLRGTSLCDSPDKALHSVDTYYWGGAKRALAAAVRDLYNQWNEIKRS